MALATLVGQYDLRDRLQSQLNGGRPGLGTFDEAGVVEVACEITMHRLLPSNADESRVSALAADMRSKSAASERLGQLVLVEVIRAALGRQDVDFKNMYNNSIFAAQGGIVSNAYFKRGMDEAVAANLVADAETIAFKRGWSPPLAE